MKITGIRTRVFEWAGETVTPQANFCTTASDLLDDTGDALSSFRFHGWMVVEVETDAGIVGIGNAALSPRLTKHAIDLYLKPLLLGENLFDYEYLWQKMYRRTLPFGRKGVGMVAISAVDIAIWDAIGKALKQPVFRLLGGRTKKQIPVYASKLYSQPQACRKESWSAYKSMSAVPKRSRQRRHARSKCSVIDEITALICGIASEECSFTTDAVFDASRGRATY